MTQETLANTTATDATDLDLENQAGTSTKSYTQAEVDAMMARTRTAVEKRYENRKSTRLNSSH